MSYNFKEFKKAFNMTTNQLKALQFAEKYGVIEYKNIGSKMIYYTNYPGEHNTYKCIVDLKTMKETRTRMAKYYKKGNYNYCL